MLVRLENVRCKVLQADEGELRWLRTYLTFPDERARFGLSTGLHLFNSFAQSFPAGLLPIVLKGAPDADVQVTVEDGRTVKGPLQNPDLSWLRDYQGAAVVKCVEATRGIMKCPTGSGKTEIAIGLASKIGCRWLFLVHRASLLQQTAERYEGRVPGETAGRVGDHQWQVEGSRFVVGMFQTIHAALKSEDKEKRTRARALLGWAEGLIVDECFVAGTPVGGQPIETLREGDTIPSYDSRAGQFVRRRIVRRFARRPSAGLNK